MSRAVLQRDSSLQSPDTSNLSLNSPQMPRRQSLDTNAAVTNYRRRLSLAVPEKPHHHHNRGRLKSDITDLHRHQGHGDRIGDASQSPDRPPRRKKPSFKKGLSLGCEPISEEQELSPLIKDKSSPSSPTSPTTKPTFEIIHENEELDSRLNRSFDSADSPKKEGLKSALKKTRSVEHDQVKHAHTDPTSEDRHISPDKRFQSAKRRPLMKTESVKSDENVPVEASVDDDDRDRSKSEHMKQDSTEVTTPKKEDSYSNEKDEIL